MNRPLFILFFMIIAVSVSINLFAQTSIKNSNRAEATFSTIHEVSGLVIDSTDTPIAAAAVTLTVAGDTLRGMTTDKGIFIFKNVKSAEFVLKVTSLGYAPVIKKYFFNENTINIILDPIYLGVEISLLKEVVVDGTPSIIYKTDTTEYRAADYKVSANARVDELLKKMQGVTLGRNGTLSYQGLPITAIKVNGKRFGDGSVAQTIQNLPAEIVDRAQFINDYGDEAARTGVKDGDPRKILNLTTLSDKSIANIGNGTIGAGNNDRYSARLFLQRINANEQLGIIGNLEKILNGVAVNQAASEGTPGVNSDTDDSGGNTENSKTTLNYRDQWGKYIQVNSFYSYNQRNINSLKLSDGNLFSSNGTSTFTNDEQKDNRLKNHQSRFELELTPDSANFLRAASGFTWFNVKNISNQRQIFSGYQNQDVKNIFLNNNTRPAFETILFYQHLFQKKRRNISIQLSYAGNNQNGLKESKSNILYRDRFQVMLKDSLQHFLISRANREQNFRSSITYIEPVSQSAQFEINVQTSLRSYNNEAATDSINLAGQLTPLPSLNNNYQYTFRESRLSFNYRLLRKKYNISLGVTTIPTILKGTQHLSNIKKSNLSIIPIFRYEYIFSRTERVSVNYYGTPMEPSFLQLQPVIDYSDPQNVIIGNPYLKPSFHHNLTMMYNHFLANSKMNISVNGNAKIIRNKVTANIIQVPLTNVSGFYNEFHYLNIQGAHSWILNHAISKQFGYGKLMLQLEGSVLHEIEKSASNNITYSANSWSINEMLGLSIIPQEWLEINPNLSYNVLRRFFKHPDAVNSNIRTTALNLYGRFFWGNWKIGYEASKHFNKGIDYNLTKNPFVINLYVEKALLNHNNGLLRVQMFDILKQNNIINQIISNYGITNIQSNPSSRYGFLSFTYSIQKWSGSPKKNGEPRKRRGDGSFIY